MWKTIKIIDTLIRCDKKDSINLLVEICQTIALSYLHYNYRKVYKFLRNENITLEEFALDAIAPLFCKDEQDNIISIQVSFKNWQPEIKTEDDALFFLNKIIASRIEQHIYSFLKEGDPFFSKILDSINYLIKTPRYKKSQSLGKTYIIKSDNEICDTLFISPREFENVPAPLFSDRKTLIPNLLDYLEKETKFVAAIPLNDLIYRLKHINFSGYTVIETSEMTRNQFEMNEIINVGLASSLKKLNNSYCAKGKLNEAEGESIKSALVDICEDLKNGGINIGLYKYLTPYINDLSKETYKDNYQSILEYLLKITKSVIADNLQEKK